MTEPPNDNPQELQAVVSANTLLLPVLLPRLYPPLYTLYVLHNQKLDDLYWERLQKWNRQSDSALMNFLGVDPKFFIEEIAYSILPAPTGTVVAPVLFPDLSAKVTPPSFET